MYIYLLLIILSPLFPFLASFEKKRVYYASRWKYLFTGIFFTGIFFIIWDIFFTRDGSWGFNEKYLVGKQLLYLPVEEWLFFMVVPFASVFIYDCVIYFSSTKTIPDFGIILSKLLGIGLTAFSFCVYERNYTFFVCLFAGLFLLFIGFILKPAWIHHFYIAYLLHLIPFFLVNGILTGSITEEPIVWYNNNENLGIRIGTVPVEDSVYALLLLMMNVFYYEQFKKQKFKIKSLWNEISR